MTAFRLWVGRAVAARCALVHDTMMDVIKVTKVEDVRWRRTGKSSTGTLHLTAHHLIFSHDRDVEEEMWLPYPLISLVMRLPHTLEGRVPLTFHCRDFNTFSLSFKKERDAVDVFDSVRGLTVAATVTQLYAFFYTPNPPFTQSNGWSLYSTREEFSRMGVGSRSKAWRFTDINKDYTFCPTYPARLVVPTRISDTTLQYASKYRSKCRIPALVYLHWANFGTITRSSQPMVGITNSRSVQDEKLIEAIFQSHHNPDSRVSSNPIYGATATNLIIDARPTTNAVANVAKGAGTENMDYYKEGKKAYLGVDNIHVMRDSLNKVVEALREADAMAASIGVDELQRLNSVGSSFLDRHALRRSGWLRHISAILDGTVLIVKNVHINSSHVLIHCSDGWDRTAQLSSLAQLCLDPFYRTIRGFQILVEKDWLSFGHKFLDRCGHLSSEKFFMASTDPAGGGSGAEVAQAFLASVQNRIAGQSHLKEISPVFHQFLECVRQLQRQNPKRFEFNSRFLEQIHYHLYSCQFGSFLYNNERERRTSDGSGPPPCERTVSVWDLFNSPPEMGKIVNDEYDPALDDPMRRDSQADMGVLVPKPKDVRFWHELYGRTDEEMNGRVVVAEAAGAEIIGPFEGVRDDPMSGAVALADDTALSASMPIPSPPSPLRTPSPFPSKTATLVAASTSSGISSSMPELSKQAHTHERTDTFRPFDSTASAFTMHTNPLSHASTIGTGSAASTSEFAQSWTTPTRPGLRGKQVELLGSGVKSMWGRLSTNATAAFSAVQSAYDKATQGIEGTDVSDNGTGELHNRLGGTSQRDWTSSLGASSSTVPPRTEPVSGDRWRTQTATSGLASLSLENPWGTSTTVRSGRSTPKRAEEIFSTQSVWNDERSHSPAGNPLPASRIVANEGSVSRSNSLAPSIRPAKSESPLQPEDAVGFPGMVRHNSRGEQSGHVNIIRGEGGLLPSVGPKMQPEKVALPSSPPPPAAANDRQTDPLGVGVL